MISIVIPFYRQIDNIKLILKALESQSYGDFEVTLAEDDHHEVSKKQVLALIDQSPLDVTYIRHTEKVGLTKTKIVNKSICYHLYHKKGYTDDDEQINRTMMNKKIEAGKTYCTNGLDKYLQPDFVKGYEELYGKGMIYDNLYFYK